MIDVYILFWNSMLETMGGLVVRQHFVQPFIHRSHKEVPFSLNDQFKRRFSNI